MGNFSATFHMWCVVTASFCGKTRNKPFVAQECSFKLILASMKPQEIVKSLLQVSNFLEDVYSLNGPHLYKFVTVT